MKRFRYPIQSEAAECGLACISVCLEMLGSEIDLASLRYRYQVSSRGLTLKEIAGVCGTLDLTTRAIKCDVEELGALRLPAILHWEFNHFVVLQQVKKSGVVVIVDPAKGERTVNADDVGKSFTGVAIEISPANGFTKRRERSALSIWSLFTLRGDLGSALIKVLLISVLLQAYTVGSPFFLQLAIDEAALKMDVGLLQTLAIGFGLFALLNSAAEALRGFTLQYASSILGWEMSTRIFHHMLRLPLAWFQRRKLADALSRFDSLDPIKNLIANGFVAAIFDGVLGVTLLVAMFVYASKLAWITLAGVAMIGVVKIASVRHSMKLGMDALQAAISERGKRIETLRAMQTIKLLGGEGPRETDWANRFGDSIVTAQHNARFQVGLKAAVSTIESLTLVLLVYLGSLHVVEKSISIGMLYAFLSYRQQFSTRVTGLIDQLVAWRLLDMHSERLADIALHKREDGIDTLAPQDCALSGNIELRGVSYRYSEYEPFVFRDLSLQIKQGELIAIVGPSGSGKSTFLKLLTGLYAPVMGQLLFDGIPSNVLGPNWIRRNIGVVMQDDELLSGTIAENVCFFADQPDVAQIWSCLERASLVDEVRAMPMRLHTLIGDMGNSLSGGQRQRLLLARALYRRPRILFMDEATSNLDVAREKSIHTALQEMAITRVFVTHRPEAARLADRIFHLDKGRLRLVEKPSDAGKRIVGAETLAPSTA